MTIMDLFRPKFRHSDWSVRRKAAEQLSDQALLIEIATTDKDFRVRRSASDRITDKSRLVDIAINDENVEVRHNAIEGISSQFELAKIAKRGSKAALAKVKEPSLVDDIAISTSDSGVRYNAIKRITNQVTLAEIAKQYYYGEGMAALSKVTDQTLLADIAMNARDRDVYQKAIETISNETTLVKIVKHREGKFNSKNWHKILTNINDQSLLTNLVEDGEIDAFARVTAAEKLIDRNLAEAVCYNLLLTKEETWPYHSAVLKQITNQALLAEIANRANNLRVRNSALNMVTDMNLLVDIATTSRGMKVGGEALISIAKQAKSLCETERKRVITILSELDFDYHVAIALTALGWEPKSCGAYVAYFKTVGWPTEICSKCYYPYEDVPGHTGGDDYYAGIGEACTVTRCSCHIEPSDRISDEQLINHYRNGFSRWKVLSRVGIHLD